MKETPNGLLGDILGIRVVKKPVRGDARKGASIDVTPSVLYLLWGLELATAND